MGPSIEHLGQLLSLPHGCGEQNMVNFAPNTYILTYLHRTGQLTADYKSHALEDLVKGNLLVYITRMFFYHNIISSSIGLEYGAKMIPSNTIGLGVCCHIEIIMTSLIPYHSNGYILIDRISATVDLPSRRWVLQRVRGQGPRWKHVVGDALVFSTVSLCFDGALSSPGIGSSILS